MTEAVIHRHGAEEREQKILLMPIEKNCFECEYLREDQRSCDAFPDGIPSVLLYEDEVHDHPFLGDHGIRFRPRRQHSSLT